jgi:hypothetical protein
MPSDRPSINTVRSDLSGAASSTTGTMDKEPPQSETPSVTSAATGEGTTGLESKAGDRDDAAKVKAAMQPWPPF